MVLIIVVTALALSDLRCYFFDEYDNYALGGPNRQIAAEVVPP